MKIFLRTLLVLFCVVYVTCLMLALELFPSLFTDDLEAWCQATFGEKNYKAWVVVLLFLAGIPLAYLAVRELFQKAQPAPLPAPSLPLAQPVRESPPAGSSQAFDPPLPAEPLPRVEAGKLQKIRELVGQAETLAALEALRPLTAHSALAQDVDLLHAQFSALEKSYLGGAATQENYEAGERQLDKKILLLLERLERVSDPGSRRTSAKAFLPPEPLCFGRAHELPILAAALLDANPQPAIVLGSAGMGKSTLCLKALHQPPVEKRFGERRFFINCETAKSASEVAVLLAQALGLALSPDNERNALDHLASQPAALVLDNAETPWLEAPRRSPFEELLAKLAGIAGLKLLVAVRGQGEKPHGVRWRTPLGTKPLDQTAARETFLATAGDGFANDPLLPSLLAELDGLPLAIYLLAKQAEGEPDLKGLHRRWNQGRMDEITKARKDDFVPHDLKLLRTGDADHRLTNLELSLRLSLDSPRLSAEARRLFSLLGKLPAGIALEDLETLAPGYGDEAAPLLRRTGLAFDRPAANGQLRLTTLAPVREFAAAHCPATEEDALAVMFFYCKTGEGGKKMGGEGGAAAAEKIAVEFANAAAQVKEAFRRRHEALFDAALGLGECYRFTGTGNAEPLRLALELAKESKNVRREADCLRKQGDIALDFSEHEEARRLYELAKPLYEKVGDVLGQANCIQRLGDIALRRSEHEEARRLYELAKPLFEKVGDVLGQANCIRSLGDIALRRSEHEEARRLYELAKPLFEKVGSVLGQANCIRSLGDIALERSEHEEARRLYELAKPLYEKVGDVLGQANCIQRLGDIALRRSEHEEARRLYELAKPLFEKVGDVLGQANCIQRLGDIALERSEHEEARRLYELAKPLYEKVGAVLGQANCIQSLGDIALAKGEPDAARSQFQAALAMYERIREPYSIGWAHRRLARLAKGEQRRQHVQAAKKAWEQIDFGNLEGLREEFPGEF